jgi:hypothetical protein
MNFKRKEDSKEFDAESRMTFTLMTVATEVLTNRMSHKKTKINNENSIKRAEWVERSYKFDSLSFLRFVSMIK